MNLEKTTNLKGKTMTELPKEKLLECSCGKIVKVSPRYIFIGNYKCSNCRPKKEVIHEKRQKN